MWTLLLSRGCLAQGLCMSIVGLWSESEGGRCGHPGTRQAVRGSGPPAEAPCSPALCPLQTDREHLTAEAKELRQKVKYLQDQLSPLTRQREYQEKEIQRLNKVGAAKVRGWAGLPGALLQSPPHGRYPQSSAQEG